MARRLVGRRLVGRLLGPHRDRMGRRAPVGLGLAVLLGRVGAFLRGELVLGERHRDRGHDGLLGTGGAGAGDLLVLLQESRGVLPVRPELQPGVGAGGAAGGAGALEVGMFPLPTAAWISAVLDVTTPPPRTIA